MSSEYRLPFSEMLWETQGPFMRSKTVAMGDTRLRLLEIRRELVEEEWCEKPHTGYVLEGSLRLDFKDDASGGVTLVAGDGLHVPAGRAHKGTHLTPTVRLILFEDVRTSGAAGDNGR